MDYSQIFLRVFSSLKLFSPVPRENTTLKAVGSVQTAVQHARRVRKKVFPAQTPPTEYAVLVQLGQRIMMKAMGPAKRVRHVQREKNKMWRVQF